MWIEFLSIPADAERYPDFDDQEEMLSEQGFFENTPENAVLLFEHIFRDTEFTLENLEEVPHEFSTRIIQQYQKEARTIEEYCKRVWESHESAKIQVLEDKKQINKQKLALLKAKKKGLQKKGLPRPEIKEASNYKRLMQEFKFTPSKNSDFESFREDCVDCLKKDLVTLRLPRVFQHHHYDYLLKKFESVYSCTASVSKEIPSQLQDVARRLFETAKKVTIEKLRD